LPGRVPSALNPPQGCRFHPRSRFVMDVSVQAQILNLLKELRWKLSLSYLFISHNLSVVKFISNRIAVMYLGKIVESADSKELFTRSLHPYTQALLSSIPVPEPNFIKKRVILQGEIPTATAPPSGCRFHPRCQYAQPICGKKEPNLIEVNKDHFVACHLI